jgi:DNA transposition AAA+ family ATPase
MEKIKYPENLYLLELVKESGRKIEHIASKIGTAREIVSRTINGHYKGNNIVPLLRKELGLED